MDLAPPKWTRCGGLVPVYDIWHPEYQAFGSSALLLPAPRRTAEQAFCLSLWLVFSSPRGFQQDPLFPPALHVGARHTSRHTLHSHTLVGIDLLSLIHAGNVAQQLSRLPSATQSSVFCPLLVGLHYANARPTIRPCQSGPTSPTPMCLCPLSTPVKRHLRRLGYTELFPFSARSQSPPPRRRCAPRNRTASSPSPCTPPATHTDVSIQAPMLTKKATPLHNCFEKDSDIP